MQFLYPTFLLALLTIAIPIIIHLFHFRRFKKVYFTNVKFLKEVKEETSARSKIRNLLVLLARILAISFLVFAFAQPFIPQKNSNAAAGSQTVSIFIDNSFSMSSLSQDVPLLDKAKERANQIIDAYTVEDEFQILTNDFEGRHQRLVSQEDAFALVEEIKVSPSVQEISKVLVRQEQVFSTAKSVTKASYIISDFQKNITDIPNDLDSSFAINLIPLQSVQKRNISIDSCWFEAPAQMINQTNRLIVKLRNLSDENREDVRLTLRLDGQVKPLGNLNLPPRSVGYDTVNLTILRTGWHEAVLSITDFPINFDDDYHFAFNVAKEIRVLAINDGVPNPYINAAFGNNAYFKIENTSSTAINYATLPDYQFIITNELKSISSGLAFELQQYVKNGGNLLVFPNAQVNKSTYNSFLKQLNTNELGAFEQKERQVADINTEEFIFNDVFENRSANLKLPATTSNYQLTRYGNRGEEVLLQYRDGGSYLSKYDLESGSVYLCAAPLSLTYNDLAQNAEIFVPMLYKIAISNGKDRKIAYIIGRDNVLETENRVSNTETVYKLKGDAEEFIPQQRAIGAKAILNVNNQVKQAGFYELYLNEGESLSKFAFNYDRKESELEYMTEAELQSIAGTTIDVITSNIATNFTDLIGERSRGIALWRWCIILALIFLAIEVLLLRVWKV